MHTPTARLLSFGLAAVAIGAAAGLVFVRAFPAEVPASLAPASVAPIAFGERGRLPPATGISGHEPPPVRQSNAVGEPEPRAEAAPSLAQRRDEPPSPPRAQPRAGNAPTSRAKSRDCTPRLDVDAGAVAALVSRWRRRVSLGGVRLYW